jgi:hypothetical protein
MVANIYLVGERGIFLQMTDVIGNRDTENDVVTRAPLGKSTLSTLCCHTRPISLTFRLPKIPKRQNFWWRPIMIFIKKPMSLPSTH